MSRDVLWSSTSFLLHSTSRDIYIYISERATTGICPKVSLFGNIVKQEPKEDVFTSQPDGLLTCRHEQLMRRGVLPLVRFRAEVYNVY